MNLKGPEAVPEAMLVAVPAAVPVQREIFLEYAEDRAYEPEINIIKAEYHKQKYTVSSKHLHIMKLCSKV